MSNIPIIISGPTAVGKTAVALHLAKKLNYSIISVDSRQIYKGLNVGTAAPLGTWKGGKYLVEGVPYHLVDFLPINEVFDVSRFISMAREIANKENNKVIFTGGSGMYFQNYFCGMDNLPKADLILRARLAREADMHGREALHKRLQEVDPQSAKEIPYQNIHRLIRALEIYELTGKPASELKSGKLKQEITKDKAHFFYLDMPKGQLLERIIKRTYIIFEPMVKEAKNALNLGFKEFSPGLKSLGYPQIISCLKGEISKEQAKEQITILTRQYAKRQRTWFGRYQEKQTINCDGKAEKDIAKEILNLI
ncbi:MAG: tRNA (adenosine(37)-N6)-dimethylallyltransferase MiaA [Elusimicrobiaceae bacterium]|nr:tRNA (adenosine(37)-N6)-dimethylallyltransferase MiaA [Elusimicrobiaceae bacterium]